MYHSRYRKIAVFFALPLFATGCANSPHNDVLIFGTNTKVAFDVSSDPANAGTPSFTLGYKRQELALVPLKANGTLVTDDAAAADAVGRKYIGTDGDKKDTYSVFASFGGTFGSGKQNDIALSQFFATGIAAQHLGASDASAKMISVQPVNAEIVESQKIISALHKELGDKKVKEIEQKQKRIVANRQARAAVIVMKVTKVDGSIDDKLLGKAIKDGQVETPWSVNIPKMKTAKALNDYLEGHVEDEAVISLYEQLK